MSPLRKYKRTNETSIHATHNCAIAYAIVVNGMMGGSRSKLLHLTTHSILRNIFLLSHFYFALASNLK